MDLVIISGLRDLTGVSFRSSFFIPNVRPGSERDPFTSFYHSEYEAVAQKALAVVRTALHVYNDL